MSSAYSNTKVLTIFSLINMIFFHELPWQVIRTTTETLTFAITNSFSMALGKKKKKENKKEKEKKMF